MTVGYPTRTLRELARVFFSRIKGILFILILVLAAVVAASFLAPWTYQTQAMLHASPAGPTPSETGSTLRDRLTLFVVTQRQLVESDYVLASALMKLDGQKPSLPAPGASAAPASGAFSDEQVESFITANHARLNDARKNVRVETPGGPDVTFTSTFTILVDWPEERDKAASAGQDSKVYATLRAQQFTKHLLESYLQRRADLESQQATQSADFLVKQSVGGAEENLKKTSSAMELFIKDKLKGDILQVQSMLQGVSETGVQSLRTQFQAQINTIDARLAELAALTSAIQFELAKTDPEKVVVPEAVLKGNPALTKIVDSIVSVKLRLNSLRPRFTEDYNAVKEAVAELTANVDYLKSELDRQRVKVQQETDTLSAQRKTLTQIVLGDRTSVENLASMAAEYKRLKDAQDNAQLIYNKRLDEALSAQSKVAMSEAPIEVRVIDAPSRPDPNKPHRPVLWLNILVGLAAGLILALVYAFLADHLDHSVKSIDDVERYVDLPVLASVPKLGDVIRTP